MWVRTVQDASVSFQEVNPRKFLGDYTPMVTLEIERRQERAELQKEAIDAFQMMIQDSTNNLQAIKEIMYKKMMPDLTPEEIEQIITPPAQPPMEAELMGPAADAEPIAQEEVQPNPQMLGEML